MPTLLLQKPSHNSKRKAYFEEIKKWEHLDKCLRPLQLSFKPPNDNTITHVFSHIITQGKEYVSIKSADGADIYCLVLDILKAKQPPENDTS